MPAKKKAPKKQTVTQVQRAMDRAEKKAAEKEVKFKNVRAFVKAALAGKLPRGTRVVITKESTYGRAQVQSTDLFTFRGAPVGPEPSFVVELLKAIGIKSKAITIV